MMALSVLNATGLARTETLKVRLSREEAEIRRRATALGIGTASYARSAALGAGQRFGDEPR